jgi:hypothetical protein
MTDIESSNVNIVSLTLGSRLHETGTKLNRDHFVSVIVLFIIDVYMRPARK